MSDHRSIPTPREVNALCAAVRDGQLDDEQRERLAQLLDAVGSAVRVTPTMAARYRTSRSGQRLPVSAAGTPCPAPMRRCWRVASCSESATAAAKCGCPRAYRVGIKGRQSEREAHVTVASAAVSIRCDPAMHRGER